MLARRVDENDSAHMLRWIRATTRSILALAVERGLIAVDPSAFMVGRNTPKVLKTRKVQVLSWNQHEVQTFLLAIVGDPLETLWVVMINTGLRRGEALALTWDDLDLDAKTLSVSKALVQIGGVPTLCPPKTQRSYRTIAINSATVQALRVHRKNQRRLRLSTEKWTDTGSVFTNSTGQLLRPDYAYVCFKRIVTREGLPWIRLHGLRHTHASLLILAGIDVATVSERLGHADVGITVRTYLHGSAESDREAAASFGRLLAI